MDQATEREAVVRAVHGDTEAFESLLADAITPGHRFACALLHDPSLAEDAVQEAALLAWSKLRQLAPGRPFRPWFLGIVANQCRDQIRGRWWRLIRTSSPEPKVQETPEQAALRRAELREALMKLRDRERQVLVLRIYLELPWSEVAAVTRLTVAGARTSYYRALERLRPLDRRMEAIT